MLARRTCKRAVAAVALAGTSLRHATRCAPVSAGRGNGHRTLDEAAAFKSARGSPGLLTLLTFSPQDAGLPRCSHAMDLSMACESALRLQPLPDLGSLLPGSQESTDSNSSADGSCDGGDAGKKLNRCNLCDYTTNRRSNLVRHLFTMHQTNVDQVSRFFPLSLASDRLHQGLECCDITFSSKSLLKEHKKKFHAHGYQCRVCRRPFCRSVACPLQLALLLLFLLLTFFTIRRALLKRHMNVHSGRKEFACDHCDYATSHKSNLERHSQRLHGIDLSTKSRQMSASRPQKEYARKEEEEDEEEVASVGDDSRYPRPRLCLQWYQCLCCNIAFQSQLELAQHGQMCAIQKTDAGKPDESVILAALALTQLKYGSPIANRAIRTLAFD